jgi:hypothetical protein
LDYIVPASLNLTPDGRVIGFVATLTVVVGIAFRPRAIWQGVRAGTIAGLRQSSRTVTGTGPLAGGSSGSRSRARSSS